jgi:hypothetical protein
MATWGPIWLPGYIAGNAEFRAWAQGIHDGLASFADLTQTADTGQINIATATRPAANGVAGYEVWRFNDAMQATMPVFFKLEYGIDNSPTLPQLIITIGKGSNGAGTITTPATRLGFPLKSLVPKVHIPWAASCTPGQLDLVGMDTAATTEGVIVHMERSRDAAGTPTADGVVLAGGGQVSAIVGATATGSNSGAKLLDPMDSTIYSAGRPQVGKSQAISIPFWYAGKPIPGLGVVAIDSQTPMLVTLPLQTLGGVHTYLTIGNAATSLMTGFTPERQAILWE